MKNCLIIEDNNTNVVNLINILAYTKMEVNILGITLNMDKILKIIKNNKVDMIIIDIVKERFDVEEFLFRLEKEKCIEQGNTIILFTEDLKFKEKLKSNFYINKIIIKPCKVKELIRYFKDAYSDINEQDVYNRIKSEMLKLSFTTKYIGTQYLIDCIYEVYNLKRKYNYNLFNDILPILSKKYNKSIDSIYGDIKQAINKMIKNCDQDYIINYFKLCEFERPKPKQIIDRVLENLKK